MIEDYYVSGFSIKGITNTKDGLGSNTKVLSDVVASLNGKMRPLSANESYKYQQMNVNATNRFYCSYNASILQEHIIYDGINYYDIIGIINPMNDNEFMQIDCSLNNRYADY